MFKKNFNPLHKLFLVTVKPKPLTGYVCASNTILRPLIFGGSPPRVGGSLSLFLPQEKGGFSVQKRHPFRAHSNEPFPYRGFIIPIRLSQNPQKLSTTIYLRVHSVFGSLNLPLYLWRPVSLQQHILGENLIFGLFYGIFLAMFLYNVFLYFSIREKIYLDYVIYMAGLGIYIASYHGVANQYLWPDNPWWNCRAALFFTGIALCGALRFIAHFLQTKQHAPRHHHILIFSSYATLSLTLISLWDARIANTASLWLALFTVPFGLSAIIQCTIKGHRSAYFVLLGWSMVLLGSFCQALSLLGFLPLNNVTQYALLTGAVLESILFSFALADRVNTMNLALEAQSKQLSEQNLTLSRLDQLKDQLIANTSHELRTPLNGMIGLTESLLEGSAGPLPEEAVEDLTLIARSSRRLAVLVNDLLDFSRLRQQRFQLDPQPVALGEVVDLVLALSLPQAQNKQIQLRNNITPQSIPAVFADENRLQQILHNLIGNAIKFTNKGHIEISAKRQDDCIAVTVLDTGIGIKKEDQERIFRSFEQVDGSSKRSHDGLGLGLAITKQLVELHQGTIQVQSQPNQGTRFTFTLPISKEPALSPERESLRLSRLHAPLLQGDLPLATEGSKTSTPPVDLAQPIKLLVVDDDPINLRVLQHQLDTPSYQLVLANNGEQALQKIENEGPFDLILLDIMMPHMSGYEVTQKLREHHDADRLPVIMLTAKNQVSDLIAAFQSGANDYITKPYAKGELIARIQHQLHAEKQLPEQ